MRSKWKQKVKSITNIPSNKYAQINDRQTTEQTIEIGHRLFYQKVPFVTFVHFHSKDTGFGRLCIQHGFVLANNLRHPKNGFGKFTQIVSMTVFWVLVKSPGQVRMQNTNVCFQYSDQSVGCQCVGDGVVKWKKKRIAFNFLLEFESDTYVYGHFCFVASSKKSKRPPVES